MKKLVTLIALAVLGGGGWYAYSQKMFGLGAPRKAAEGPVFTQTVTAEIRDIEYSVVVSGDVLPASQLDVKAEVGGRIKKLNVLPGDTVKEGEVLVEIDDRDILTERDSAITEIEGANLTVDKMKKNYERALDLFKQKLISQEAYDNLGSELAIAKNSLSKAERKKQLVEDKLSKTKVIAPGNGTVLVVPVVEGQVIIAAASVNSGSTLMTIADLSRLLVETHVNQVDVAKLAVKQDVKLTAESIKDEEMAAVVAFIAPVASVKNSVKGFTVKAIIEKPSPRLRPGMSVQVTIPVAHAEDVVAVPIHAVFRGEGNSRVVYVRNGDKTERRVVKVGVSNTDFAQIIQGLQEGEQILLAEPERSGRKRS
jgi:RND family efflux transporter MFP subunit